MNFRKLGSLVAVALAAGLALSACAQVAPRGSGRMYNAATETTLEGSVTAVKTLTGRRGWNGVHLTLQAPDGNYDVHVGPANYVSTHGFTFATGDHVKVVGSKLEISGVKTVIAREITKDGKVLTLRDKEGFPVWSRGAMGRP
jgi:DNA/RNA endonuclease YhcR with UshA esterase domain